MLLPLSTADGATAAGEAVQILDRTDADGPLVEAPSLARGGDGTLALLYSSHCYSSHAYDVRWATAAEPAGPYARAADALVKTGDLGGLVAPGGAGAASDAGGVVFHADCDAGRCMYGTGLVVDGGKVALAA